MDPVPRFKVVVNERSLDLEDGQFRQLPGVMQGGGQLYFFVYLYALSPVRANPCHCAIPGDNAPGYLTNLVLG